MKSFVRVTIAILSLTGAILLGSEAGIDINREWEWAIPLLVIIAYLLTVDEIVSRMKRQLDYVKDPLLEATQQIQDALARDHTAIQETLERDHTAIQASLRQDRPNAG